MSHSSIFILYEKAKVSKQPIAFLWMHIAISQVNSPQPIALFGYRRARRRASDTTYAMHIQISDVLVRVTTVKWFFCTRTYCARRYKKARGCRGFTWL